MTDTATTAGVAAARYSQNLHVLVDRPMRAITLGLADLDAEEYGGTAKEGDTVRNMLTAMIDKLRQEHPATYAEAVKRGRTILAERDEAREARAAAAEKRRAQASRTAKRTTKTAKA